MAQTKRNCSTCEFAKNTNTNNNRRVKCTIKLPPWPQEFWNRLPADPEQTCKAWKPMAGVSARICLNCDKPIRQHRDLPKAVGPQILRTAELA